MGFVTVSQIARRYGIPPKRLSDLFYLRKLDDSIAPVVGGRRIISEEHLPAIEAKLRELGILVEESTGAAA